MKTLLLTALLVGLSAYYVNVAIDKVYTPVTWLKGIVYRGAATTVETEESRKKKEQMDTFFKNVVDNIEHLKKITDSYDNYTDVLEMTVGFDKIEEFLLRLERRDFLKTDDFNRLRLFVRQMEKFQRRLFYQEKQNINVLKNFLPQLMLSISDTTDVHQQQQQQQPLATSREVKGGGDDDDDGGGNVQVTLQESSSKWLTSVNARWFVEYSSQLVQFLEIVGNDFFEMRKLVDEIENRIMEVETSVYRSHLLAATEGKLKHISLNVKRESNLHWLFQILSESHNVEIKTLEMDLLELSELKRYQEFVVKFLNKKRRMVGDIEDFNESVLKKTTAMSAALGEEKPSPQVLYRFAYELNSLHLLVKDRHDEGKRQISSNDKIKK